MTAGDEPPALTPDEQRRVDEAHEKFHEAWRNRPDDAELRPVNERLNGPVFVDGDGNLQHDPGPEVTAKHAEFLRRSEQYARLRAERDSEATPDTSEE